MVKWLKWIGCLGGFSIESVLLQNSFYWKPDALDWSFWACRRRTSRPTASPCSSRATPTPSKSSTRKAFGPFRWFGEKLNRFVEPQTTHSSLYQRGNFLKRMRLGQSLMWVSESLWLQLSGDGINEPMTYESWVNRENHWATIKESMFAWIEIVRSRAFLALWGTFLLQHCKVRHVQLLDNWSLRDELLFEKLYSI